MKTLKAVIGVAVTAMALSLALSAQSFAGEDEARGRPGDRVAFSPRPLGPSSGLAFVFPGMIVHP